MPLNFSNLSNFSPGAAATIRSTNAAYDARAASARRTAGTTPAANPNTQQGILQGQENAINALNYTPIDIAGLQQQAEAGAARNAANSLMLERNLSPGVAATRTGLQDQVASDLNSGGALPADVVNQVSRASAGQAGASGLLGSQAPSTAASLGLTALQLHNQRLDRAGQLLSLNPLPESGLSPGDVASATIGNANAQNQFNLSKLGALGNVANSRVGQLQSQLQSQAGAGSITLGGSPAFAGPAAPASQPTDPRTGLPYGVLTLGQQNEATNRARATPQTLPAYAPGY